MSQDIHYLSLIRGCCACEHLTSFLQSHDNDAVKDLLVHTVKLSAMFFFSICLSLPKMLYYRVAGLLALLTWSYHFKVLDGGYGVFVSCDTVYVGDA